MHEGDAPEKYFQMKYMSLKIVMVTRKKWNFCVQTVSRISVRLGWAWRVQRLGDRFGREKTAGERRRGVQKDFGFEAKLPTKV